MQQGAHARGVVGVVPTVTYPSHTTLMTGLTPREHGIISNTPFDPLNVNKEGWYWYAEDLKVPTLWDACAKGRLVTSSVDWPVTVGANITFNIVQYWRAQNDEDRKLIRALSTPGLFNEAETALGAYTEGNDYSSAGDARRAAHERASDSTRPRRSRRERQEHAGRRRRTQGVAPLPGQHQLVSSRRVEQDHASYDARAQVRHAA